MGRVTWAVFGLAAGPAIALEIVFAQVQKPPTANSPGPRQAPMASRARADRAFDYTGTGSCAAVACHGGIAPLAGSRILRNEFTTWASDDPHSRAFQVLLSGSSKQIVRKLAGNKAGEIPAYEDQRCLACHTTPMPGGTLRERSGLGQDGVGCESCHGPAEAWLGKHTTYEWAQNPDQKSSLGFSETKNLVRRVSLCVECHVGQHSSADARFPRRDVNHDLIAAGHPRLTFEFASYLDNYPHHWKPDGDEKAGNYPAKAWAIGQVATARAALELLRDRAGSRLDPWPEFSEYGCFSCHHSLRDEAWRRQRATAGVPSGAPEWGSWPFTLSRELGETLDLGEDWKAFVVSLDQLKAEMVRLDSDRTRVIKQADQAASPLNRSLERLDSMSLNQRTIERLIQVIDGKEAWKGVNGWDQAAQRYLAIVPLRQALIRLDPGRRQAMQPLKTRLESLLRKLRFPEGLDSPRGFDPTPLWGLH